MPAQIAHIIFAEEALEEALSREGEDLLSQYGNIFRFGAQGPDFFYHNQRTRPTGLKYGIAAHREGYGRLVKNMILEAFRQHSQDPENPPPPLLMAYILGFATHAVLDRKTHPYINYHAGWVEPGDRESDKYFRCHVFLERILDVLLLKLRRGRSITAYAPLPLLECGEQLPYLVIKTMLKGLHATYPRMRFKSRDRRRIENAYRDAIFFYTITDPSQPHYRQMAFERDRRAEENLRRLALFHPLEIPADIDFLNLEGKEWVHPCDDGLRSRAGFLDLYEEALPRAVTVLKGIWRIARHNGEAEEAEELLGNESLDSGFPGRLPCRRRFAAPLPLPELIAAMYRRFELALSAG